MTRKERVQAALAKKEVDRPPVSVWLHFPDVDQCPRSLAEHQVYFNEKFDYDFIKLMPFGAYSVSDWGAKLEIFCNKTKPVLIAAPGIESVEDYYRIEPLHPTYGTWGKQLQLVQHMSKLVRKDTPFIQTLFTPLTTLRKLTGDRLLKDMQEAPEAVHKALVEITKTSVDFAKACIEAGVSGFFYATQCSTTDYISREMHAEFCKPYDLQVANCFKDDTYFNVMHIHGSNILFDILKDYPLNCINWHDRHTEPSLAQAKKLSDKAFLGGINEVPMGSVAKHISFLSQNTPSQIKEHVREAIAMMGDRRGLLIGPGCVADPSVTDEKLQAVREAVNP